MMTDVATLLQAGLRLELLSTPFGPKAARQVHSPHGDSRSILNTFKSQYPPAQSVDIDEMIAASANGAPGATVVEFGEVVIDRPGNYTFVVSLTALATHGGHQGQVMLDKIETGMVVVH